MSAAAAVPPPVPSPQSQSFAHFFNELRALDAAAVQALLSVRVPCNRALAEHPTVPAQQEADGSFTVGTLGLFNGLLERLGGLQKLAAVLDMPDGQQASSAQDAWGRGVLQDLRLQQPQPGEPGDMRCKVCSMQVERLALELRAVPCGHDNTQRGG